jgi:H+/Cl- antiporter ClcA
MARRRLDRSSRTVRVVGPALLVLALVGVVAVAATGSSSEGSGSSTRPSDVLLDTLFSLVLVLLVAWVAVSLLSLARWRELEWTEPRRRNDLRAIATLLAFGFALALYIRERGWHLAFDPQPTPLDRGEGGAAPPGLDAGPDPGYRFEFAWLPVAIVLVLAAAGVAAFVLAARRSARATGRAELAVELADTLDVTIDDLRAETDPRRAVIAAYARLERVLAAHGEPRKESDTPEEHLARVLGRLDVDRRASRRLVALVVRAVV